MKLHALSQGNLAVRSCGFAFGCSAVKIYSVFQMDVIEAYLHLPKDGCVDMPVHLDATSESDLHRLISRRTLNL